MVICIKLTLIDANFNFNRLFSNENSLFFLKLLTNLKNAYKIINRTFVRIYYRRKQINYMRISKTHIEGLESNSIKKTVIGFVCKDNLTNKGLLDTFDPPIATISTKWKNWITMLDPRTCLFCLSKHGEIYDYIPNETDEVPPLHDRCRCKLEELKSIVAGTATKNGTEGADYWLKRFTVLPECYITKTDISTSGWRWGKSPVKYAPGKMIGGDIYSNRNGHLPSALGRIWYECDINYYEGKRNGHRIVYSNDGLIFVTYNHYKTFYEII